MILDDRDCFALREAVRQHWVPVPGSKGLRYPAYKTALRKLTYK